MLLPNSKTGPRAIWLGKAARKVLAGVPRTSSPLVFPGAKGKLLGHRRTATTERYAHLEDSFLISAAERVSARIAAMLG